ncbi:MAG: ATP-binding protein [Desertimonas sp.]
MEQEVGVFAVEAALRAPVDTRARELLAIPENQWFDLKSARIDAKTLAQNLSAFANADGGVVVVGVNDKRQVEGVEALGRKLNDLQQASRDFCEPRVPETSKIIDCVFELQRHQLLVVTVPPSDRLHRMTNGDVYLRVGDEKRRLSTDETVELQYDKSQGSFETHRLPDADASDIDQDRLANYARLVRHPDPARLLRDRTLTKGDDITVAGCLLFSPNPAVFLPTAIVRVTRWIGRNRSTGARQQISSDVLVELPIPDAIAEAQLSIERVQPTRRALSPQGRFEETPTVPSDAWLEGLVNAVLHRSYSLGGDHIHVDVFDDRIEITSPGSFPHRVDLSNLDTIQRFARNPRIVHVCHDLGICQQLGEGIVRMFTDMRRAGLNDPLYRQTTTSVTLTLSAEPLNRDIDARYHADVAAVLSALRDHERLSTSELTARVGKSKPSVRALLRRMQEARLIRWRGKSSRDPRAYWYLHESQR